MELIGLSKNNKLMCISSLDAQLCLPNLTHARALDEVKLLQVFAPAVNSTTHTSITLLLVIQMLLPILHYLIIGFGLLTVSCHCPIVSRPVAEICRAGKE